MDAPLRPPPGRPPFRADRHAAVVAPAPVPERTGWKSVELAQRGKMILDVARVDLDEAEARLGPFHPTTWHFRHARDEARRSWDRLRAEYGTRALEAALAEPPQAILTLTRGVGRLAEPVATLILIGGQTYSVEQIPGTPPAPLQYRLIRLPPQDDDPYYACRLRDGSTQCDCAQWIYQVADIPDAPPCKHIAALESLGWL